MAELAAHIREWQSPNEPCAEWPASGWAVMGDFAGIQGFVLRPVPGVRGAAKRLRGRSLLVLAYSHLIAEWVKAQLGGRLVYVAGGRFLAAVDSNADLETELTRLQAEIDRWSLRTFGGEVLFHLAWSRFTNGKIPNEGLKASLARRRARPLATELCVAGKWALDLFYRPPASAAFRCPSCLATGDGATGEADDDQLICSDCVRDRDLGARLARLLNPRLKAASNGMIHAPSGRFDLDEAGVDLQVVRHLPRRDHVPMSLEEVAGQSIGARKWLAYLRIDADKVGDQFDRLDGAPRGVLGLSRFLHGFFWGEVQSLIDRKFRMIYPVYGGGDDLFVIGPWDQTLEFAGELAGRFSGASEGRLRFSAGVALSKPRQHILAKSSEAEKALHQAKEEGGGRIRVLGISLEWRHYQAALRKAQQVAGWHDRKRLTSAFLHQCLELHRRWKENPDDVRYRPLLHYQIARNIRGRTEEGVLRWAMSLLEPNSDWERIGFICRYAMLAAKSGQGDRDNA